MPMIYLATNYETCKMKICIMCKKDFENTSEFFLSARKSKKFLTEEDCILGVNHVTTKYKDKDIKRTQVIMRIQKKEERNIMKK